MERNKTARILALIVAAALLAVLVIGHVQANRSQILEVSDEAQTLTATAAGRNGPVTVEVIADDHTIYSVKVTQHEETEGIGSVAVTELPAAIVQNQSVLVDAVSGATSTSSSRCSSSIWGFILQPVTNTRAQSAKTDIFFIGSYIFFSCSTVFPVLSGHSRTRGPPARMHSGK